MRRRFIGFVEFVGFIGLKKARLSRALFSLTQ
jgi:hypothetical protein